MANPERERLAKAADDDTFGWRRWGTYVSERAWASVREDYSPDGNAWDYLPHDLARSQAYRWGEDGIAGWCDRYQLLIFAPAFWNGRDPILKERLFGLTSTEGNHGEDVKECYFHVDNTPTHSYARYIYKYPQAEYPYLTLIRENAARTTLDPEYELVDTGVFDEGRYFDVVIEYAKASEEDTCIRIEAFNRGPDPAPLHILPHLWFRNTWSWGERPGKAPRIVVGPEGGDFFSLSSDDAEATEVATVPISYRVGRRILYAPRGGELMFTDNESNPVRVTHLPPPPGTRFFKDAFHRSLIQGEPCTNPARSGTRAAIHYRFDAVPPGGSARLDFRLTDCHELVEPLAEVGSMIGIRRAEADLFYDAIHPQSASRDERLIQRQAWAGTLWTKQSYLFDVNAWLEGDDPTRPPPESRKTIRNQHWRHLNSMRIMSVCDKWEYPWFAAWDLAFHCVVFTSIDAEYAKQQLWLLLFEQFQHSSGQIPAYEWEFSDLNPPVHAWAVWRVYNMDRIRNGRADRAWLEKCYHKLLLNFTWWVNKVDREGNNIFEGGFLGLDNITVIDRSRPCNDGSTLEQSDGTGWMGMFCLVMMRMALELARENPVYEALASKFLQHYTLVAAAMKHMGSRDYQLWDEADGFFYDVLRRPNGQYLKFRIRSMVGLIPLLAVERLEERWIEPFKTFKANLDWFLKFRAEQARDVVHTVCRDGQTVHVLTILNKKQLRGMVRRMFDPAEFLSDYGLRSLSKAHADDRFAFNGLEVGYEPAESTSRIKGGNSNWRGPIWFPTGFLLIESLRKLGRAFGSPSGPSILGNSEEIPFDDHAREVADRMIRIFTRDLAGQRPVFGDRPLFQNDPHWRDLLLFYEYFHGDTGAGLGASHQTGWTALVASMIEEWRNSSDALAGSRMDAHG